MKTLTFPLLLLGLMISGPAIADNPANTVEVLAVGSVTVPSDTVVLGLSIETRHADLREARKRNDQIAAPIYELAESQHVTRPTLLATNIGFDFVPPQTDANQEEDNAIQGNQKFQGSKGGKGVPHRRNESPEPPVHMSRNLEVRFHNLNEAVTFLTEMLKWDSVRTTCELRLAPLSFGVSDRDKILTEARRRAVKSAGEKALLLAEQNGLKLGRATLIYDDSSLTDPFGEPGRPALTPPVPRGMENPFGISSPNGTRGSSHVVRLVATQRNIPEKLDLDHVPPAQISVSASVKIVFELNKP